MKLAIPIGQYYSVKFLHFSQGALVDQRRFFSENGVFTPLKEGGFWCIWGFWAGEGSLADRGPTGREAQMPCFRLFPVTDESDRTRVCGRRRAIVRRCTRTFQRNRRDFAEDAPPIKSIRYGSLQYQFGTFDIECTSRPGQTAVDET